MRYNKSHFCIYEITGRWYNNDTTREKKLCNVMMHKILSQTIRKGNGSMAALAIFTAVFAYADLMWPLICNTDLNMMTLSAGLSTLNGQYTTNFPVLMAGSLLAMIPMVILYLIFQKQFIQGIAMTGGK